MDDNCLCDNDKLHLDDDAEGRCGPSQSLFSHDDDARGDLCRSGCEIRELQPDGPRRASSAKTTLIVLMMFRLSYNPCGMSSGIVACTYQRQHIFFARSCLAILAKQWQPQQEERSTVCLACCAAFLIGGRYIEQTTGNFYFGLFREHSPTLSLCSRLLMTPRFATVFSI